MDQTFNVTCMNIVSVREVLRIWYKQLKRMLDYIERRNADGIDQVMASIQIWIGLERILYVMSSTIYKRNVQGSST